MTEQRFHPGDIIVCTQAAKHLTVGRTYAVLWNRRPDINFPTVMNDAGRPTQYSGARFERECAA
ncbi:MAG: hypothetical protein WBA36_18925 [Mesorhizobium sp.]